MTELNTADAEAVRQLEQARALEEGFTPRQAPKGETPERDATTVEEITLDQWNNATGLIEKQTKEIIELKGLLRRYQAQYGDLES